LALAAVDIFTVQCDVNDTGVYYISRLDARRHIVQLLFCSLVFLPLRDVGIGANAGLAQESQLPSRTYLKGRYSGRRDFFYNDHKNVAGSIQMATILLSISTSSINHVFWLSDNILH